MDNSDQLENPDLLERDTWIGTLCGYFRDFLETDFKKSRAPKRSISRVDSTGLKVGFDISQYPALREDIVSLLETGIDLEAPSRFQLARGRYRSSIKKGLLTLIRGHLESISDQSIEEPNSTLVSFSLVLNLVRTLILISSQLNCWTGFVIGFF
jgi:hypothetical protein